MSWNWDMPELGALVEKVRSKNAGPFWITVDVFCGTAEAFDAVRPKLTAIAVARVFDVPPQDLKRFEIPALNVLKFSFPRHEIQGDPRDRDMHGASYGPLLAEMMVD